MCRLILTFLFILSFSVSQAQYTLTDDDVIVNEHGAIVYCSYMDGGEIIIPDQLDGVTITSIGSKSFKELGITTVHLPLNVISIRDEAFEGNKISHLDLNEKLQNIGPSAFRNNQLTNILFNDALEEIGAYAFADNHIESVTFNEGLVTIDGFSFQHNKIESISFPLAIEKIDPTFLYNQQQQNDIYSLEGWYTEDAPEKRIDLTVNNLRGKTINSKYITGKYTLKDDDVYLDRDGVLIGCTHVEGKHIIIPSVLDGKKITKIGSSVFDHLDIESVQFPEGVVSIGENCFFGSNLKDIQFPSTLKSIGHHAFCVNDLRYLELPDSLESIQYYAFSGNQITSLKLPKFLKTLRNNAFSENNLRRVELPQGLEYIYKNAFGLNRELSYISFPKGMKYIEFNSFDYYYNGNDNWFDKNNVPLETVSISDEDQFFWREMTYPENTISYHNVENYNGETVYDPALGMSLLAPDHPTLTFVGWYSDAEFNYPIVSIEKGMVGEIDLYAKFEKFYTLNYYFGEEKINEQLFSAEDQFSIEPIGIENYEFRGWYTDANFTELITTLPNDPFQDIDIYGQYIPKVTITLYSFGEEVDALEYVVGDDIILPTLEKTGYEFNGWYNSDELINEVDPIDFINDQNIYAKWSINEYTITYHYPDLETEIYTVASVGQKLQIPTRKGFIFNGWFLDENLTQQITKIQQGMAENIAVFPKWLEAYALQDKDVVVNEDGVLVSCSYEDGGAVIIPPILDGVEIKRIGDHSFYYHSLTSVSIPEGVESIGKHAFYSNQLEYLELPESLLKIEDHAFERNKLVTVDLPESLIEIGIQSFYVNDIVHVVLRSQLAKVGDKAFMYNEITEVHINDILTDLGTYVFANNIITEIVLPETIETVPEGIFDQNKLTSVVLPSNIQYINKRAFASNHISSLILPKGIKSIGEEAFTGNSLTNINLPNGLELIADGAFRSNKIREVIFPTSIQNIGPFAFAWNLIQSTELPETITEIADGIFLENQLTEVNLPPYITKIGHQAFESNEIEKTNIPESVTYIGNYAFQQNELKNIPFPENIEYIGDDAFSWNNIEEVILPSHLDFLGEKAFSRNEITKVQFPKTGLTTIKNYTFSSNKIDSLEIPENIETIGEYAFYQNELSEVIFPSSLITIESDAFGRNRIDSVKLPQSLAFIGEEAFKYNSLEYVEIPRSVKQIDSYAFMNNCLDSIFIPQEVETLGYNIFSLTVCDDELGYEEQYWLDKNDEQVTSIRVTGEDEFYYIHKNTIDYEIEYKYVISGYGYGGTKKFENHHWKTTYTIEDDFELELPEQEAGYTFGTWHTDYYFNHEITKIEKGTTGKKYLHIRKTPIDYSIQVNGVENYYGKTSYTILDDFSFSTPKKEGYGFRGWFSDEELQHEIHGISEGSMGEINIYSKWEKEYKLTFLDGEEEVDSEIFFRDSEVIVLPTSLSKKGYEFNGWYTDPSFTTAITEIPSGSTGDIALHSKWELIEYSIYYHDGNTDSETYTVETDEYSLITPTKPGYTFEGWYLDESYTSKIETITKGSTGDLDLYPKWKVIEYSITYNNVEDYDGLSTYTIVSENYLLSDPSKEGYSFMGWFIDDAYTTSISVIETGTLGNIDLYAKWDIEEYTIHYHGVDDTDLPKVYTIESEDYQLKHPEKLGYTFEGWYLDESYTSKIETITKGSTGDLNLYSKWEIVEYTIIYNNIDNYNGLSSYTVLSDTYVLTKAYREGYTFEGWYLDESLTSEITEISKGSTGNLSLYAKWELQDYSIYYHDVDNFNGVGGYSHTTETFQLEAPIRDGYNFVGWYLDQGYNNAIAEVVQGSTGDLNLYAKWEEVEYLITYQNVDTYLGVNSYTINSPTISLSDPSKNGYQFEGWFLDQNYTDKQTSIPTGSLGDITLYAKWSLIEYTISYEGVDNYNGVTTYSIESETFTLTIPENIEGEFDGWYTDPGYKNKVDKVMKGTYGDLVFYAKVNPIINDLNGSFSQDIHLYPNPSSNYFSLNIHADKVSIYSYQGLKLKEFTGNGFYDISDLATGVYMVHIKLGDMVFSKKLVVN
ncbi:leucine-rich repeat protein [Flammeovirga agarivorans]|uniref:Leucine-rich repeat protein n=1 Tax=Flammeovirga agarivorans TaxID=2726742 RepID=A0A7X8SQE4_9BACT|nr:leucine-rich repeat protein [Flammeovirga agarivorans]NLR94312.1 leucine-rich repeat protein [Flammeovirga agarivorans]